MCVYEVLYSPLVQMTLSRKLSLYWPYLAWSGSFVKTWQDEQRLGWELFIRSRGDNQSVSRFYLAHIIILEKWGWYFQFSLAVPPKLILEPTDTNIVVRADTTVALRCKATGNPPPQISWRKKNDRLPATAQLTDGGMTLTMGHVTRHHTGTYECEANNGVGQAVSTQMELNVRCKWIVGQVSSWVNYWASG